MPAAPPVELDVDVLPVDEFDNSLAASVSSSAAERDAGRCTSSRYTRYGCGSSELTERSTADATTRIVRERNRRGDDRVRHFFFGDAALDLLGCDWHPSLNDHRTLANLLTEFVARLPLRW